MACRGCRKKAKEFKAKIEAEQAEQAKKLAKVNPTLEDEVKKSADEAKVEKRRVKQEALKAKLELWQELKDKRMALRKINKEK